MEDFVYRRHSIFNQKRLNPDRINKAVKQDRITKTEHSSLDLMLLKYSHNTYYNWDWDPISVFCRGLVVNENGTIIARPFYKFFNHNKLRESGVSLPNSSPHVMHKYDGFMITIFYYNNSWHVATSGAFGGEHARLGQEWVNKQDKTDWPKDKTLVAEYLSSNPEFQIVVPHDEDKVNLLAVRDTKTGEEWGHKKLEAFAKKTNFEAPKRFNLGENDALKQVNDLPATREGFVLWYPDANVRTKLKGEAYLEIHKLRENMTPRGIHDLMSKEGVVPDSKIAKLPDEFYDRADEIARTLEHDYNQLSKYARSIKDYVTTNFEQRSEIGKYLQENYPDMLPLVFSLIDGDKEQFQEGVYKAIRPDADEDAPF